MKKYGKIVVWIGGASGKIEEAMAGQAWFFHLHAWDYQQGEVHRNLAIQASESRVSLNRIVGVKLSR